MHRAAGPAFAFRFVEARYKSGLRLRLCARETEPEARREGGVVLRRASMLDAKSKDETMFNHGPDRTAPPPRQARRCALNDRVS